MAQLVSAPMRLEFCRSPCLAMPCWPFRSCVQSMELDGQGRKNKEPRSKKTLFIPNEFWIMMVRVTINNCLAIMFHIFRFVCCISVPVRFLPVYKAYKVYTLIEGGSCLNPPFRHKMLPGPCDWMYCGGNSIGNGNKPEQAELLIRLPMVLVAATRYLTFNFNFNFKVNFTLKLKL